MADADAQPPERIAHLRDDIAHAVVSAGAAALLQAHDAGREIELVVSDQDRLRRGTL